MQTRCGLHDIAHLTWLQCEGSFLKFLLHVTFAEVSPNQGNQYLLSPVTQKYLQIPLFPRASAITFRSRKVHQTGLPTLDFALVTFQDLHSFFLTPRDLVLSP